MKVSQSNLTESESWELIQSMIQQAKNEVQDDGFFYLLWGWLVLIACLLHYLLGYVLHYPYPYAVWLLMLIGIGGTLYQVRRRSRKQRVKTYIGRFMSSFWFAIFIAIMIALIGAAFKTGYQAAYPIIIAIYGVGTFSSGSLLRFSPLMAGGAISWIMAIVAFFVSFPIQLLLLAFITLVSYLIPGYLLKAKYRHERV